MTPILAYCPVGDTFDDLTPWVYGFAKDPDTLFITFQNGFILDKTFQYILREDDYYRLTRQYPFQNQCMYAKTTLDEIIVSHIIDL